MMKVKTSLITGKKCKNNNHIVEMLPKKSIKSL